MTSLFPAWQIVEEEVTRKKTNRRNMYILLVGNIVVSEGLCCETCFVAQSGQPQLGQG